MTEAEVQGRIQIFGASDSEPVLNPADIEVIIAMSKRVDQYGVQPGDAAWEGTYDWNYAVAQAWLIKAGRLADRYLFMTGGKMLSRHQFYAHCMELHKKYLGRSTLSSLRLAPDRSLSLAQVPSNAGY
jgi:DUF971 family protein